MFYMRRLGSLGNSPSASGRSNPGGTVCIGPSYNLGRRVFFYFIPSLLFFMIIFLLTFFCYFVLFTSWRYHTRVFGKTLLHEFHISYRHTEWSSFLQQCTTIAEREFGARGRNTDALVNLYHQTKPQ